MKADGIRPLAICVFRDGENILVAEGTDDVKGETFYRPLGGAIEFGEYGQDTVIRELREEIGAEITGLRYLGALENVFTYMGERGHEIVLVFDGAFVDQSIYTRERIDGNEDGFGPFIATWKPLSFFASGGAPLYPDGLLALLRGEP
ncbi:MAG TPA: NUDIX hydrolase [bacterium]|nr:NUDIX hydrolase [bacterium]